VDCTRQALTRTRVIVRIFVVPAFALAIVGCIGQPAGGIVSDDSPVVALALRWAASLQQGDATLFASTINPSKLAPPGTRASILLAYDDALVATFAECRDAPPDAFALVTDGTQGRERYMVIGRYGTRCLQRSGVPATDTFVLQELTVDGMPKVDGWTFGAPPGR